MGRNFIISFLGGTFFGCAHAFLQVGVILARKTL